MSALVWAVPLGLLRKCPKFYKPLGTVSPLTQRHNSNNTITKIKYTPGAVIIDDVPKTLVGYVNPDLMNGMRTRVPILWGIFAMGNVGACVILASTTNSQEITSVAWGTFFFGLSILWTTIIPPICYGSRTLGRIELTARHTVRVSHVDMFGRRRNMTVPISSLVLNRQDHIQRVGGKMYFIDWKYFKCNETLWNYIAPTKEDYNILIPDTALRSKKHALSEAPSQGVPP